MEDVSQDGWQCRNMRDLMEHEYLLPKGDNRSNPRDLIEDERSFRVAIVNGHYSSEKLARKHSDRQLAIKYAGCEA